MLYTPHPYQAHAKEHILNNPACGLFLDMGLGKTVSTLTALEELMYDAGTLKPGRTIIIAPKKVAQTVWTGEAAKWDHLQHLKVVRILGDRKRRLRAMNTKADIYVTSRDFVDWLVKEWGQKWPYRCIVIDELSNFKNPQAVRFRQLRKVRPLATRVIGLTGTPSPNGLMDLWAPMYLLDRGERLEKTLGAFRDIYLKPLSTDGGYVVYKWGLKAGAEQRIYDKIGDICISMKSEDWLDLPEVIPINQEVELSPEAEAAMKELEAELVMELDGEAIVAETAASLNGKLSQMAGGAVYSTSEPGNDRKVIHIHDDKLDALEELTEALAASGENALVVYWYKHMKDRIKTRFGKRVRELKTEQDVADWNAGKIPLLLIHPASAGHGLNLQDGGNVTIWVELPAWDLELYQQVNKRLHRQGQTRPVRIIHLLAQGTIDEDQMRALEYKDVSQNRLMEAVKARLHVG